MKDARDKAEQLAELGEVKLGKPMYISEGMVSPVYQRDYFEKAAGAPTPVETPISQIKSRRVSSALKTRSQRR